MEKYLKAHTLFLKRFFFSSYHNPAVDPILWQILSTVPNCGSLWKVWKSQIPVHVGNSRERGYLPGLGSLGEDWGLEFINVLHIEYL